MLYTKPFDIVVNPPGSLFAKRLQEGLQKIVNNFIFRRKAPKVVPEKRTIISRKGNILRRGTPGYTRTFFSITPRVLNKVEQLEQFTKQNIPCPAWTTNSGAIDTLGAKTIFARTLINSTNGRGIVEFELGDVVPRAPLYTAYIPKKAEYRFHVFGDKVIDVQEKKKSRRFDADNRDTRIRNIHNGYVYCRDNVVPPAGSADLAIRAVRAVGYQYGAVDIIYNEKRNQSYVLEVNSRPGLMGTTLEKYVNALITTYNLERK